jgi:glycyl-tRNA synthetase beta chain
MPVDFLCEIGVEEIPASIVRSALAQLSELLGTALARQRLSYHQLETYGTPRRLTALVHGLAERQADAVVEHKGPPAAQAFDEAGRPTIAALRFAEARGVRVEDLEVRQVERGSFVFARVVEPGRPAGELLPELLRQVAAALSFPKTMRWGQGDFRFCRPVRWVVALLGDEVLPVEIAGVQAGRVTRGHRLFGPRAVVLGSPQEYLRRLEESFVIASHEQRRQMIAAAAARAAAQVGGRPRLHEDLLEELTFMVEYPMALVGSFPPEFLALPEAVVVKVLEGHQRVFAVEGAEGELLPYFVAIRDGTEQGLENVRHGYERVVQPRLEDAQFYLQEDLKRPFAARRADLRRVTFVAGLGSLYEKTERLVQLVKWLAAQVGASPAQVAVARRAAELCKNDLTTMMVSDTKLGELQGLIGGEYARRSGEPEAVAQAIAEHYQPRGAEDPLPSTLPGQLLASADRLDNLVAAYALGLRPSGSEDPYALRRQMQGLLQIAVGAGLRYPLAEAAEHAYALVAGYAASELQGREEVLRGLRELAQQRLETALQEAGVRYDLWRAVNSSGWADFVEAWQRAQLLAAKAAGAPEWEQVVRTGQRIANIYRPARDEAAEAVRTELLRAPAEQALWAGLQAAQRRMAAARAAGAWEELWQAALGLAPLVERLFDEVLIMAEEAALRANRLALLGEAERVLFNLADLREVVLPGD